MKQLMTHLMVPAMAVMLMSVMPASAAEGCCSTKSDKPAVCACCKCENCMCTSCSCCKCENCTCAKKGN